MIFFQPYGPFPVKRSDGHIDRSKEAKRAFWDMANKNKECLNVASGCGCYVFAIRTRRGVIPWYVGKAERQGFEMEIFTNHKLLLYNEALKQQRRATSYGGFESEGCTRPPLTEAS